MLYGNPHDMLEPFNTIKDQIICRKLGEKMKPRKAISPVIAIIIIVAVTIAIAVAVAGWLMGLWGGYARGGPSLQITYAEARTNGTIIVTVANKGSGTAKIDKILINAEEPTSSNPNYATTVTLSAGTSITFTIEAPGTFYAGQNVNIEIIDTNSGARATASVPAAP